MLIGLKIVSGGSDGYKALLISYWACQNNRK